MEFIEKHRKDLQAKIDYLKEQLVNGSSFDDCEGISLEYKERMGSLRAYEDALEKFNHTVKAYFK